MVDMQHSMTKSARILIVDDEPAIREMITFTLIGAGLECEEAADADEAEQKINHCSPDLILLDINLPDLDGYTVATRLRKRSDLENTPIVALTANVMQQDQDKSIAAGCDGFIQKPIDVDSLPDQIRSYLV